ncbi:hypothetical protein [Trichocoleus sp. FACHB-262]|nr:hypothetical protein [Trichocoleus sp. FACHB-262]MBD2122255.1 hypothetical protein [Trichocoleus sp. FACHB-262]
MAEKLLLAAVITGLLSLGLGAGDLETTPPASFFLSFRVTSGLSLPLYP